MTHIGKDKTLFPCSFTIPTFDRLRAFVARKFGARRALSITIEEAVKLYLDTQEALENPERFK